MSTDGSGPAASSLYAQALHSNNFRAHVAHGRVESGVLALLRRKIHELSQPDSGADFHCHTKINSAKQLQVVADKLLILPGDVEAWATLRDHYSAENTGIRPGVLSAILASMLQVDSATEATPAPLPTVDNFLPTFVRRAASVVPGAPPAEGAGHGGLPARLARGGTYHASKIGHAPSSLFGQAMHLWRHSESGESAVVQLLKTRFGELAQRHSAEERAQAQELQAALERLQADALSGAAWHLLSAAHFAAPNSGLSSVQFAMQLATHTIATEAAQASAAAGNTAALPYAQYATNEGQ